MQGRVKLIADWNIPYCFPDIGAAVTVKANIRWQDDKIWTILFVEKLEDLKDEVMKRRKLEVESFCASNTTAWKIVWILRSLDRLEYCQNVGFAALNMAGYIFGAKIHISTSATTWGFLDRWSKSILWETQWKNNSGVTPMRVNSNT